MQIPAAKEAIAPLPAAPGPAQLRDCLSPASFWHPEQLGPEPAWIPHAPFAFWLVEALRPRAIVELGTHGGYSYFALCQAVQRLDLNARCHAVDTWNGDEHAGFYGEEVYEAVRARNDCLYAAFSTLLRCTFDEALPRFDDASIDLLHIDGRHRLMDVRHDFESWRPKLSERAVVLFHDTNTRAETFGVWRYWAEVSARYPHFEFLHGHGLGVLGVGRDFPAPVRRLFEAMNDPAARMQIREAYGRLGAAISLQTVFERQATELARRNDEAAAVQERAARAAAEAQLAQTRAARAQALLEPQSAALDRLSQDLAAAQQHEVQLGAQVAERNAALQALETNCAALVHEIAEVRASTSWRITAPLRWARRLLG